MIDTNEKLAAFTPALATTDWIALDTEADSLHAYPEKLCLLQFAAPGVEALVDPLAKVDLAPLWKVLGERELIFHAADYDLRLLARGHSFVPAKIFDTMLAARLLGEPQFGLNNLVEKFLGVKLEKSSQKANWGRRPLTPKMTEYAINDVRHLKALSDLLRQALVEKGRLAWHQEWCARLIRECAAPGTADPDPWRIRGSSRLPRPALAVLREIWQWRENEAIAANRPPFFILQVEAMTGLAVAASQGQPFDEFIPRHLSPRRRDGLLDAIAKGWQVPPEQQPEILVHESRRFSFSEKKRFAYIERRRNQVAEQLGLDPTIIASRATIGSLSHDWNAHAPELMGWQLALLEKPPR